MMKIFSRLPFFVLLLIAISPVYAHANLLRSEPGANTALKTPPTEIRLWFSEPLENAFSTIELRDSKGERVQTAKTIVDATDDKQLILPIETLPDGFYTVSWQALSKTDGHLTQGSFPIAIGAAYLNNVPKLAQLETIPVESAAIRWFNLLSLALFTGSIGFVLFVWQPLMGKTHKNETMSPTSPPQQDMPHRLIFVGWLLTGAATVFILLLQVMIVSGETLWAAAFNPALGSIITETRFGTLWILRLGLWFCAGGILAAWQQDTLRDRMLFVLSIGILATQSLFSHASSIPEPAPAILADFLHTLTMALWIGGLIAFLGTMLQQHNLLPLPMPWGGARGGDTPMPWGGARGGDTPMQQDRPFQTLSEDDIKNTTEMLSQLTGYFSNYMRVSVLALMLTGVYAMWLQVGSLKALLTTLYGQTLLIKLALILPLLAIAAINLFWTHKNLQAGHAIWTQRLRRLVTLEVILTVSVLGAVGVMTAISPARGAAALQEIPDAPPAPPHFMETQTSEGIHVTMHIVPGWVGENTFALVLTDANGNPVENANRVRLQFDFQEENLGRSELRPEHSGQGIYQIDGTHLTVPGQWRVRVIVARPGAYDSVVDFMPLVPPAPPPPPPSKVALYPESMLYGALSLGMGLFGIVASGLFLRYKSASSGAKITAIIWLAVSVLMLFTALPSLFIPVAAAETAIFPSDTPVKLAISSGVELPALVTQAGKLLLPDANKIWRYLPLDAQIKNIFMEENGRLWAATDKGVYQYNNTWEKQTDLPVEHLTLMHGFIFASGDAGITRTEWGGTYHTRRLEMPSSGAAEELVMLGNHDHILRVNNQVFSTPDLGLSWEALADTPPNIVFISITGEGNLFASTLEAVYVWNYAEKTWRTLPTPPQMPVTDAKIFDDRLYIIADGTLYQRTPESWAIVGDEQAAYTALAVQYQKGLWALDAANRRLWFTADGTIWDAVEMMIDN